MSKEFLKSVDYKLERAAVHLEELMGVLVDWSRPDFFDTTGTFREGRLGFDIYLKSPKHFNPPVCGTLIGDYVHNLRSALDNLAFALCRLQRDPPANPRDIYFPLLRERRPLNRKMMEQMPDAAVQMIELLQPYHRSEGPDRDAAYVLGLLSNHDKHRLLLPILLMPGNISCNGHWEFSGAADEGPPRQEIFVGPLSDGTLILSQKTDHPLKAFNLTFGISANITITVEDTTLNAPDVMPALISYTRLLIDQFRPMFDPAAG